MLCQTFLNIQEYSVCVRRGEVVEALSDEVIQADDIVHDASFFAETVLRFESLAILFQRPGYSSIYNSFNYFPETRGQGYWAVGFVFIRRFVLFLYRYNGGSLPVFGDVSSVKHGIQQVTQVFSIVVREIFQHYVMCLFLLRSVVFQVAHAVTKFPRRYHRVRPFGSVGFI